MIPSFVVWRAGRPSLPGVDVERLSRIRLHSVGVVGAEDRHGVRQCGDDLVVARASAALASSRGFGVVADYVAEFCARHVVDAHVSVARLAEPVLR